MSYNYFIGIDVSKATLDISILKKDQLILQEKIENDIEKIKEWMRRVAKSLRCISQKSLFCLEHTGSYSDTLVHVLQVRKLPLWLESGLRIKRTLGLQRGKSDKVDSLRIARYAFLHQSTAKLWQPVRDIIEQLRQLNVLKKNLQGVLMKLENLTKVNSSDFKGLAIQQMSTYDRNSKSAIKADIKILDKTILALIKKDDRLNRLYKILLSVYGVGPVLSVTLIIATNEFKNFDCPKKFACYIGIAPFEKSSGSSMKGKAKVSKLANKDLKKEFFFPSIAVTQYPNELQDYYKRKLAEGKPKMSVLNAVKNKIIKRIFACVQENRLYQKQKLVSVSQ
jgi:transposase